MDVGEQGIADFVVVVVVVVGRLSATTNLKSLVSCQANYARSILVAFNGAPRLRIINVPQLHAFDSRFPISALHRA
jgi:hypothetical protein